MLADSLEQVLGDTVGIGMNPEAKKSWFELVKKYVVELGIRPEDLYAMNEMGCPPSGE
jgi:hypothetical protein